MAITRDVLKSLCEAPRGAVVAAGAILNMSDRSFLTGSFVYGIWDMDHSDVDLVLQDDELIIPSLREIKTGNAGSHPGTQSFMVHKLNVIVLNEHEFRRWLRATKLMLQNHGNMRKTARVAKFKELLAGNPMDAERRITLV